jgi:hypothetical protein
MQAETNEQGEQGYIIEGGSVYAPADFGDANGADLRPQALLNNVVPQVVMYHISDAAEKQQQSRIWRRKVRDIIQNHQETILQFFTKPLPTDHPLKVANALLKKYGKVPSVVSETPRPPSQYFKDYLTDPSGQGFIEINQYISDLEKSRSADTPLTRWTNMSRNMLDYMRTIGDELIRLDQKLQNECRLLDSVAEKVVQITNLDDPDIEGFKEMMETYIQKQFEKHPIESIYWDYIYSIQKYSTLRDILMPQRTANVVEPLCCVCMTEVVVMAFSPCGHTFCTNCCKRTMQCHVCRQLITGRLKLYFT